jgi:DeoR/GlpR family transcriptional regulator of sugar metabolism
MLAEERKQRIFEEIVREGKAVATDLADKLKVSQDTIRRDLRELAGDGLVRRVHGGALRVSPNVPSFETRAVASIEEKRALARYVQSFVSAGSVVLMDSGTTNLEIARSFPPDLSLTVITNCMPVASVLANHPGIDVVVLGGTLFKDAQGTRGAVAIEQLGRLHADLCFLGICSLDAASGVSCFDYEEAQVKRAMVKCSADVVAVVPREKLGTVSPHVVCPAGELTHLVTTSTCPPESLEPFRKLGLSIRKTPNI